MKKQTLYTIISSVTAAILVFAALLLCQELVRPKYVDQYPEGRFIAEYYKKADKDFDVIFLGDCEVYEGFSPVVLWQEYGINSYIRGSAQQYIWQSYYLLEDTLKFHTPKAVVLSVGAMRYDKATREAYNRMTLDGMRWSPSKVKSIMSSATEEEHLVEYLFPVLRYHDRWDELTPDDVKYMFKAPEEITYNGYYMNTDVKAAKAFPDGKPLPDYAFDKRCFNYIDMIRMLCVRNNVDLILVKAPALYPYWYDEYDEQIVRYANKYNLEYINYLKEAKECGLDYDTNTYDGGLHTNLSGAEKLSIHIGKVLLNKDIRNRRGDEELEAVWEEEILRYKKEIAEKKAG